MKINEWVSENFPFSTYLSFAINLLDTYESNLIFCIFKLWKDLYKDLFKEVGEEELGSQRVFLKMTV